MINQLFPTVPGAGFWDKYSPFAYSWDIPNTNVVNELFGGGAFKQLVNFLSNTIFGIDAAILHIAILFTSYFSDPTWAVDPVAKQIGAIFHFGYKNVFLVFLPLLAVITSIYIFWQYAKGHHAKMVQAILSTVLSSGLITLFFFQFSWMFNLMNNVGTTVTDMAGTAIVQTVTTNPSTGKTGTNVASEYDGLWDSYVTFPWEFGEFGGVASSDETTFDVPSGNVQSAVTQTGLKGLDGNTNWVDLLLTNPSPSDRSKLTGILFDSQYSAPKNPVFSGQTPGVSPTNVNPYWNLLMALFEIVLIIPPVAFLVYVGFTMFIREIMFLVTMFMGIVTVPAAFIPEVGWRVTAHWVREALGHMVERLANVVYGAIVLALSELIEQNMVVNGGGGGLFVGFIINAMVFAGALFYRPKIFNSFIRPASDYVRYGSADKRIQEDEQRLVHQAYQKEGIRGVEALRAGEGGQGDGHAGSGYSSNPSIKWNERFGSGINRIFRRGTSTQNSGPRSETDNGGEHHDFKTAAEAVGTAAAAVATDGASLAVEGGAVAGAEAGGTEAAAQAGARTGGAARRSWRDKLTDRLDPAQGGSPRFGQSSWYDRAHSRESFTRHLEDGLHAQMFGFVANRLRKKNKGSTPPPTSPRASGTATETGDDFNTVNLRDRQAEAQPTGNATGEPEVLEPEVMAPEQTQHQSGPALEQPIYDAEASWHDEYVDQPNRSTGRYTTGSGNTAARMLSEEESISLRDRLSLGGEARAANPEVLEPEIEIPTMAERLNQPALDQPVIDVQGSWADTYEDVRDSGDARHNTVDARNARDDRVSRQSEIHENQSATLHDRSSAGEPRLEARSEQRSEQSQVIEPEVVAQPHAVKKEQSLLQQPMVTVEGSWTDTYDDAPAQKPEGRKLTIRNVTRLDDARERFGQSDTERTNPDEPAEVLRFNGASPEHRSGSTGRKQLNTRRVRPARRRGNDHDPRRR